MTYRIKPLEWDALRESWLAKGQMQTEARNGFMSYYVRPRSSMFNDEGEPLYPEDGENLYEWRFCRDEYYDEGSESCASLEAGKAACEAHWRKRLEELLEPVRDGDVSVLRDALEQAKSAIGDRLLGRGRLSKEYAAWVMNAIDTALASVPKRWLPIEQAPKTNRALLVWCPERRNTYRCFWADGWRQPDGSELAEIPTRFQPLPDPPKEGE